MSNPNQGDVARFGEAKASLYFPHKRVDTTVETIPSDATAALIAVAQLNAVAVYQHRSMEWVFQPDAAVTSYTVSFCRFIDVLEKGVDIQKFVVVKTMVLTGTKIISQKAYGELGVFVTAATGMDASNGVEIAYRRSNIEVEPKPVLSGVQTLRLGDMTGSELNGGSFAEGATLNEIAITIPGGAATPDIADGVVGFFLALGSDGEEADLTLSRVLAQGIAEVWERFTPALTEDAFMAIVLLDKTALATCNGVFWGMQYTGGVRKGITGRISNGVTALSTSGAFTGKVCSGTVESDSAGGRLRYAVNHCYDAADLTTWLALTVATLGATVDQGSPNMRIALWGGRTAATAGPVTLTHESGLEPVDTHEIGEGF